MRFSLGLPVCFFSLFFFSVGRCVLHALDFEPQKTKEIPRIRHSSGCKSAKECGKTNNNKKPVCRVFDFDPKKSVKKPKEIPRIRHRSACKFPTKKCGKIKNKKVCRVLDFEPKKKCEKNQRNTEDPPQICLQIYGQKSEEKPKN